MTLNSPRVNDERLIRDAPRLLVSSSVPAGAQGPGGGAGASVHMTNTPLPVTVTVANTPHVNVTSLPAVSLASGAAVAVGNDVFAPVPTRDASSVHVVQRTTAVTLNPGTLGLTSDASYTVPAGWRLVVEYFSCVKHDSVVSGDYVACGVFLQTDTFSGVAWLGSAGPFAAPLGPDVVAGPMKVSFEGERSVRASVTRRDASVDASYTFVFSGHLVPRPF